MASVFPRCCLDVVGYAAAFGAEVKVDGAAILATVSRCFPHRMDVVVNITVSPQHPLPTAHGAITRGCRLWHVFKRPVYVAAMAFSR